MNSDDHRRGRAERRKREEPELRWTVDYDNVISLLHCFEAHADALEEGRRRVLPVHQRLRRFVLELHEFKICRDDIEAREVGFPDDFLRMSLFPIVAD